MDASNDIEAHELNLEKDALYFRLGINSDFVFFDQEGKGIVEIELSVGKGAPLMLYQGENPLRIGARLFARAAEAGSLEKGAFLREYRADSGPVEAKKGKTHNFVMVLDLPDTDAGGEFVLEFDLVLENHYWLSDLGHDTITFPIQPHYVLTKSDTSDQSDIARAKRTEKERIRREERYEAIIFSLLNKLKRKVDVRYKGR